MSETTSFPGDATSAAAPTDISRRNIRRATVAAMIGTIIEWYDYALYGAASGIVINRLFFPNLSPLAGVLAAFATFAVGYFIRPLGGVVLSHIGDRVGRKPALILTIILMACATVAMGLLPTFAQIGVWAPVLLVLLRMLQGFGAGAELAGAITLVAEYAPFERRGFYTSIPNAATLIGIMLATVSFLFATSLPDAELMDWGWRLPFLFSALLFVVAFYIRRNLDETPEYVAAMAHAAARKAEQKVPLGQLLRNSPKEVFFGFLSVTGHNANVYILSAFALSYMTNTLGMPRADVLVAATIASLVGIVCTPLLGALSDRIGSATVYIGGAVLIFLFAIPLFHMLDTKNMFWVTAAMSFGYGAGFGGMAGAQGAFLANLFPTRYRFSGIAVARELNGVLIAGPTPLIASSLVALMGGKPTLVAIYLMVCCSLTILSVLAIKSRANNA
jgi:MFS family permease